MTKGLHLSPRHREEIKALLHKHLPGVEVWAYGSRVNVRSHDGSDLDLVLRSPRLAEIDTSRLADFIEALQDSTIPFLVEVRDWARLPESFHCEIERAHVALVVADQDDRSERKPRGSRPFGELFAESTRNGLTRPKAVRGSGVKMVNMGELFAHPRLCNVPMDRVPLSQSEAERLLLEDGDLLFARQSLVLEGAGKCSIFLRDDEPVTFESHVTRVRLDPKKAHPGYYFYYLQSHQGRSAIRSIVEQGAGASGIRASDLATLEVQWRPLPEQRAIAHILGTLDDKIELNRRMNETLEAVARALFKSWFVDFDPVRAKMAGRDTGLPPPLAALFPDALDDDGKPFGWRVGELQELVELNPKEPLTKGTKAPYLGMSAVPTSGLTPELPIDREFKSGTRFRNGDTLLARITPCLENGKTAFIQILPPNTIGWGSTEFIVMRPFGPVPKPYAYILAREPDFRSHAIQSMTGTSGRQRARSDALAEYPVSIPNEDTWEAFASIVEPIFERIGTNGWETQTLELTRDLLLPKLVSGGIRPRKTERAV